MTPPSSSPSDPLDDFGGLTAQEAEREIYSHILDRAPEDNIEPSLDRVREACDLLGNPQHAYRVIHITGTNGKSSTARLTESLVREHGLRTGLFTSPHLSSVRERIQIDGEPIGRADFVRLWKDVAPIIHMVDVRSEKNGGPRLSFFEVLTVLAFAAFADAPIDVAVVEVGLGGAWDATNVADGEVCVIAPISLDHANYLGNDIGGIAHEKSGIIKAGAGYGGTREPGEPPAGPGPAVVVATQTEVAEHEIRATAEAAGARVRWEGADIEVVERQPGVGGQLVTVRTPAATYADIFVPLFGEHQAHNALLALSATEELMAAGGEPAALAGETVEAGFAKATSPGRLEVVRTSPMIVVDAAHNPAGAEALAAAVQESFAFEALVGVVGVLRDKDADGILGALEGLLDEVVITASASHRAIPAEELAQVARGVFGEERVHVADDLPDAIDRAVQLAEAASDSGGGVLVTGSITLVADARTLLGADKRKGAGRAR